MHAHPLLRRLSEEIMGMLMLSEPKSRSRHKAVGCQSKRMEHNPRARVRGRPAVLADAPLLPRLPKNADAPCSGRLGARQPRPLSRWPLLPWLWPVAVTRGCDPWLWSQQLLSHTSDAPSMTSRFQLLGGHSGEFSGLQDPTETHGLPGASHCITQEETHFPLLSGTLGTSLTAGLLSQE